MHARVLLIEDFGPLAEVVSDVLRGEGHVVEHVSRGLEGLLRADRSRPDLVLLNLGLPDLHGIAIQRVLDDLGGRPSVMMSAQPGNWQKDAFAAGATACLRKPFSVDDLIDLVHATLSAGSDNAPFPDDVRRLAPSDLARIAALASEELDALPFGAIAIDRDGHIAAYNAFESQAAHRARSEVVGMRFVDLAPCMMVRDFVDAVDATPPVDRTMRFIFPHHHARCVVTVRLWSDADTKRMWIFVSKRTRGSG